VTILVHVLCTFRPSRAVSRVITPRTHSRQRAW
jgi:hypothetical protein